MPFLCPFLVLKITDHKISWLHATFLAHVHAIAIGYIFLVTLLSVPLILDFALMTLKSRLLKLPKIGHLLYFSPFHVREFTDCFYRLQNTSAFGTEILFSETSSQSTTLSHSDPEMYHGAKVPISAAHWRKSMEQTSACKKTVGMGGGSNWRTLEKPDTQCSTALEAPMKRSDGSSSSSPLVRFSCDDFSTMFIMIHFVELPSFYSTFGEEIG